MNEFQKEPRYVFVNRGSFSHFILLIVIEVLER